MNTKIRLSLVLLLLFNAACATQDIGPYEKFADVGQSYIESLNSLMVVAEKAAIDRASAELLDTNDFADRNNPEFNQQQIAVLTKKHESDKKRVAVFNDIRKHVRVLSKYFTRLNQLATTNEAEKTSNALAATASNLGELSAKLREQEAFSLDEVQKDRISQVSAYIVGSKQRSALKNRIKADEEILQQAINTHEVLLEAIGSYMEYDLEIINQRLFQWKIEGPFTASTSLINTPELAQNWMEERRRLLTSTTTISEIKSASRAATSLKKSLQKLMSDDADFLSQLNQLKAELEAIQTVVEAF